VKDENTYNGWKNYATWRVGLEMFDGFSIDCHWDEEEWKAWLNRAIDEAVKMAPKSPSENLGEVRAFWFTAEMVAGMADYLKELVEVSMWHLEASEPTIHGWASAFVDEVSFREIAEHLLMDDSLYNQALENVKAGAEEIA